MVDFLLPLLAMLFVILLATVLYFRFDFMQPSVLVVGMMTVSAFMASAMAFRWKLSMGFEGFLLITLSMLAFVGGGVFARWCFDGESTPPDSHADYFFDVEGWKIFLTLVVMAILLWFNFQTVYDLSIECGNKEGYLKMIRTLRPFVERNELSFGRWFNYRMQIAQLVAYVFVYMFWFNAIYSSRGRLDLRYLLPPLIYLPFTLLNTGRVTMFCFVVYALTVAIILYQKKHRYNLNARLKSGGCLFGGGIGFIAIFFMMGTLTGKIISAKRTMFIILAHYIGLSIPAFGELSDSSMAETDLIGSHTLHGVYRALQKFDPSFPSVPLFDPFVYFNGIDTNVYTIMGHYLLDYGRVGMILIMWILGVIYSFAYQYVKHKSINIEMPVMLYGYFAYPLFMSSIDERVLMDFLSTTPIYTVLLLLLYRALFFNRIECR